MGRLRLNTARRYAAGALAALMVVSAPSGIAAGSTTSAVPLKLVGHWRRHVTSADVEREQMSDEDAIDAGAGTLWRLTIKKNGDAALYGVKTFTGRVTATGANRVHIDVGFAYPNVYRWQISEPILTLTKLNDSLPIRAAILQGVWTRT